MYVACALALLPGLCDVLLFAIATSRYKEGGTVMHVTRKNNKNLDRRERASGRCIGILKRTVLVGGVGFPMRAVCVIIVWAFVGWPLAISG